MNKESQEREFLRKCKSAFDQYKKACYSNIKYGQKVAADELYTNLKTLADKYYHRKNLPFSFRYLSSELIAFDSLLPSESIITVPPYDFSKTIPKPHNLDNPEEVLDYIIFKTRNYLYDKVSFNNRDALKFEDYDLQGECKEAIRFINTLALDLNIDFRNIMINPAFNYNWGFNYGGNHHLTLLYFNEEAYLVDPTISQFTLQKRCNLNVLGVPLIPLCAPGIFMMYDELRKKVLKTILQKGYIKCTEEVMKSYMDSFLLSFRNGLFYERTGDFSFTMSYSSADYEKLLSGRLDLFELERKEELWYQLRPLENPHLKVRYKNQI